jgi:hypothetical protein
VETKEIIKNGDATEAPPPEMETIGAEVDAQDNGVLTKPFKIRKRIGYTTYEVEARFNSASRETHDDKILRLVRGEAIKDSGGVP